MKKINNIEQAFSQMSYRLQNGRYEPNQADLDAYSFLAKWVMENKKQALKNDILFAKLFCRVFAQEVHFYKGDFKFAQKKMHDYLKHPIEFYYEKFTQEVNDVLMNKYITELGVTEKHPALLSDKERELENEILKDKMIMDYFEGILKEDKVFISLNNTLTEFINKYKNQP
jgi:hypothetical protein